MVRRGRYVRFERPQLAPRACSICNSAFETRYRGREPKCRACMEHERRVSDAEMVIGDLLRRWRERKVSHLMHEARVNNVSSIVRLLKKSDYLRLLQTATPELIREVPDEGLTSFRAYFPASLISTLCARINPNTRIPAELLVLIRPMLAALPSILYPPSPDFTHGHWTHPVNFLCRGDPLFNQCRAALLDDLRWGPDVHSLLPEEIQETYILLAKILWKNYIQDAFESIIAFMPPVIQNTSSNFVYKTVFEIAEDLGVKTTQSLWEEVTLRMISTIMSQETGTYVSPSQLRMLDFRYPGFFELEGVAGVPELRSSGSARISVAFEPHHARLIGKMIRERIVTVQNVSALKALGLAAPTKVAMTEQQLRDIKSVAEQAADSNNDGIYSPWLTIDDFTAVDDAHEGPQFDDLPDF